MRMEWTGIGSYAGYEKKQFGNALSLQKTMDKKRKLQKEASGTIKYEPWEEKKRAKSFSLQGTDAESLKKTASEERDEAKTETDIIVKPDGSRVLLMTMSIGGMKTAMSLEISKPTDLPNESRDETDDASGQDWKESEFAEQMTEVSGEYK